MKFIEPVTFSTLNTSTFYTRVWEKEEEKSYVLKKKTITVTMYDLTILKVYFRLCVFLYPKWSRIATQSSGNSLSTSNVINVYIKLESSGSDQRNLNEIGWGLTHQNWSCRNDENRGIFCYNEEPWYGGVKTHGTYWFLLGPCQLLVFRDFPWWWIPQ